MHARRLSWVAAALAASVLLAACALLPGGGGAARVDLNRASQRALETLPGVTPSMARRMVDGRPYDDPRDLVTRGILTPREFERIEDRVRAEKADR